MVAIYDRTEVVKTLDLECLGISSVSSVVMGGHKVGKTSLLQHIHERHERADDVFYCKLDVDLLMSLGGMSDETFLRYFVDEVGKQVDELIEKNAIHENFWQRELEAAKERDDRQMVQALERRLFELKKLRDAQTKITLLLAEEKIKFTALHRIFDHLVAARRRVVLIIDEYDRIVRDRKFSDELFLFLRAANHQKRIVMLVASRVDLMDPSLHPAEDVSDRRNFFNHFSPRLLSPFTPPQAIDYLRWQEESDGLRLTDQELEYLTELGGGLPFFLKQVRDNFIAAGRPAASVARTKFEKTTLMVVFKPRFEQMWRDRTREERDVLRQAAGGYPEALEAHPRLECEGIVFCVESGPRIFSRLFAQFIAKAGEPEQPRVEAPVVNVAIASKSVVEKEPHVTATVLYDVFPTALALAGVEDTQTGLVRFDIDNPTDSRARVGVSISIVGYADATPRVVSVEPRTSQSVVVSPAYSPAARNLADVEKVTLRWSVVLDPGMSERQLGAGAETMILLPPDVFLMARFDRAQKVYADFSWLIAAWVNGRSDALEELRQSAETYEPYLGEPLPLGDDGERLAQAKVKALWGALRAKHLKYHDAPIVYHREPDTSQQRVQKPATTLRNLAGNCLDLAVLIASLIERCGMDPGILLLPNHALVGWRTPGLAGHPVWHFVEPTMLPSDDPFEKALLKGDASWTASAGKLTSSAFGGVIAARDDFALLVDVHALMERSLVVALR